MVEVTQPGTKSVGTGTPVRPTPGPAPDHHGLVLQDGLKSAAEETQGELFHFSMLSGSTSWTLSRRPHVCESFPLEQLGELVGSSSSHSLFLTNRPRAQQGAPTSASLTL